MKKILLLMSLVCSMQVSAQKVNPVVGLSQIISFRTGDGDNLYGTSLSAGARFNMGTGYFEVKGSYILLNDAYKFLSHQLGGNITYRILSANKRFSPYLELNAFTEVGTNYRDGYISMDSWEIQSGPEYYVDPSPIPGFPSSYTYFSQFYHSIPFYGNVVGGVDVKIVEGLHFNIGCGIGVRGISTRSKAWFGVKEVSEPSKEEIYQSPILTKWLILVDLKFGLTYAFSTKKTTK